MSFIGDLWDDIGDIGGSVWHGITGTPSEADKRAARQSMQAQIDFYKQQTEMEQSEIARKQGEQLAEKRRVEEKQIRSLRRNFRPAGFLDTPNGGDVSDKLGG
jgi:predicted XRE-type DNA-binding protein